MYARCSCGISFYTGLPLTPGCHTSGCERWRNIFFCACACALVQKYTRSAHGPRTRLSFGITYPHPGGIAVDAFEAGGWVTVECLVEAPVERSVDGQVEKPQRLQRMFHGVARAPADLEFVRVDTDHATRGARIELDGARNILV